MAVPGRAYTEVQMGRHVGRHLEATGWGTEAQADGSHSEKQVQHTGSKGNGNGEGLGHVLGQSSFPSFSRNQRHKEVTQNVSQWW